MRKSKKLKLVKFSVAKIDNFKLKGGINSNACVTGIECIATFNCESHVDTECRTTTGSRTDDSL